MEFWGVEVKAGQPLKIQPDHNKMIHVSQAALGETKKETGNDSVLISLKVNDQKMVIGTLSAKNFPQIPFDLIFSEEFELSHNWKNGSLYFCGYTADADEEESNFDSDSDKEEEIDVPPNVVANGVPEPKKEKSKVVKDNDPKVKSNDAVAKKEEAASDTDSEDEDDSDALSDSDSVELSDSDDDDSMGEETLKKVESSKKRATESSSKTPVPAKKVKLATPQKTDAKKGTAHVATPHPSKQAAKTPATTSEKSKGAATPKSAGTVTCGSCSKKFNSEGALQSHSKAKHEAK